MFIFNFGFRLKITEKLHGLTYLMEILDNILRETIEDTSKNNKSNLQVCLLIFVLSLRIKLNYMNNFYRKKMCYSVVKY